MPAEAWRNYKRFSNQFFGSDDEKNQFLSLSLSLSLSLNLPRFHLHSEYKLEPTRKSTYGRLNRSKPVEDEEGRYTLSKLRV
jgi:hypothetical protein